MTAWIPCDRQHLRPAPKWRFFDSGESDRQRQRRGGRAGAQPKILIDTAALQSISGSSSSSVALHLAEHALCDGRAAMPSGRPDATAESYP